MFPEIDRRLIKLGQLERTHSKRNAHCTMYAKLQKSSSENSVRISIRRMNRHLGVNNVFGKICNNNYLILLYLQKVMSSTVK